ncbi:hypothetical protein K438DRAFT_409593 [Mycena galopus ATCC 62051]|nr:hypothetical protein K438DRAFT_409593 [Mycena galopus ATCC 62051]
MSCKGKNGKGCSASCSEFYHPKKSEAHTKCKTCSHRKSAHNGASTVTDILDKYDIGGRSKTSDVAARKETNSGFRPKDVKTEKKSHKAKAKEETGAKVKVGSVSIITCGLDSQGELRDTKAPTGSQFERLLGVAGLAVVETPRTKEDLAFEIDWDHPQIDQWLRLLFPYVFEFLDARYRENRPPAYHWVLINKDNRTLFVMKRPTITGELLDRVKGATNRKWKEHGVRIGESPLSLLSRTKLIEAM